MSNTRSSLEPRFCLPLVLGALILIAQPLVHEVSADPAPLAKFGWTVNGTAAAAAQIGNVLYVGGRFTRVSPFDAVLGSFYGLSAITGEPGVALPVVNGQVFAIEPDGAGGYYIGGNFTMVGGQSRTSLARIRADGTVDAAFLPDLGTLPSAVTISSISRDGGRLFIAGVFSSASGAPRSGLAAIDASTGAVTPWVPATTLWIGRKAIIASGRLIAIGSTGATSVGATALDLMSGAIVWQRPVGFDSVKPLGMYSSIRAVTAVGNRIIVGGRFGASSGFSFPTCAGTLAWLDAATGAVDTTWAPSASDCGEVLSLAASGQTLYVGGTFTRLGGLTRTNLAAIDLATAAVTDWAPEPNRVVSALAVSSAGSLYVGGEFWTLSGQPRDGVAEFGATQSLTPWRANAYPRSVNTILPADGGPVLLGSSPAVSGGTARRNLAAFDLSTGALLDWQPSTDGVITDIATADGVLFVAGAFESVNGTPRRNLAAIEATSGAVLPWNANSPIALNVQSLIVHGEHVYIGGYFPSNLRRLHRGTGALDTTWAPTTTFTPMLMLAHEGRLYLGGLRDFANTSGLAAIDLASGQRLPWAPAMDLGTIRALARADETLFAGGEFTTIAGQPRANLAAFDLRTGLLTPWAPSASGVVTTLTIADRVVVAGGIFNTLSGEPRQGLGAVTFSGAPTDWNPDHGAPTTFAGGATELTVVGTATLGAFMSDLSTFALSGAPRPSSLQATVVDSTVSLKWSPPEGVAPIGYRIEAGTSAGNSNLGKFVVSGTTTTLATVAPNGTYFVRVRALLAADEPATEPSNEVTIAVGCTAPPPPPIGLFAEMDGTHITLRWTASSPTARHVLELGSAIGAADLAVIPIPAGQETFEADAPPRMYFARVRAVNACGSSRPSGEIAFTVGATGPLPSAPTGLSAVVNGGVLTLSWTAPPGPVIGYVIEAGSATGLADLATIPIGATPSLQVPGVPSGIYFVRVRAITAAGVGPPSADVVVVR